MHFQLQFTNTSNSAPLNKTLYIIQVYIYAVYIDVLDSAAPHLKAFRTMRIVESLLLQAKKRRILQHLQQEQPLINLEPYSIYVCRHYGERRSYRLWGACSGVAAKHSAFATAGGETVGSAERSVARPITREKLRARSVQCRSRKQTRRTILENRLCELKLENESNILLV